MQRELYERNNGSGPRAHLCVHASLCALGELERRKIKEKESRSTFEGGLNRIELII